MSNNGDLATVKIFKFDPDMDEEQRYETFNVPYKGMTVLNILKSIYHNSDPDLCFRWGCEGAHDCRCGACAIAVNGRPALACRRMAEAEMLIEPHPKFEVIRDLVVDFNKIKEDITTKAPSVNINVDADKCVKCADCVSLCPVGVYEIQKGEIIAAGTEFCCGDTCRQCEIFCQANAITVSLNRGGS